MEELISCLITVQCIVSLLLLLSPLHTQASHDYARQSEDESLLMDEGSGNGSNSTMAPPTTPILSPSAIANIISSVVAVVFLTSVLCYLLRSFNQNQHQSRVRTALENNRLIDEQLAKSKALAERKNMEASLLQGSRDTVEASQSPLVTSASGEKAKAPVGSSTSGVSNDPVSSKTLVPIVSSQEQLQGTIRT